MNRLLPSFLALLALAAFLVGCSESDVVRSGGLKSLYGTPAPGAPGGSHPTNPPGGGAGHSGASGHAGSTSYYVALARTDAVVAGIDADAFQRQINQESHFNPNVRGQNGEIGIAQFMPSTAAGLGINPYDPEQSLQGAAGLMGRFYRKYGDYRKALAAYNNGSGSLAAAVRNCGSAWESCVAPGTQAYIRIAMGG